MALVRMHSFSVVMLFDCRDTCGRDKRKRARMLDFLTTGGVGATMQRLTLDAVKRTIEVQVLVVKDMALQEISDWRNSLETAMRDLLADLPPQSPEPIEAPLPPTRQDG